MDPLMGLLKPEVMAAMALVPLALQFIRAKVPAFAANHAAILNFAVVVGMVLYTQKVALLHPTPEGIDVIVKNILPTVEAFVGTVSRQPS